LGGNSAGELAVTPPYTMLPGREVIPAMMEINMVATVIMRFIIKVIIIEPKIIPATRRKIEQNRHGPVLSIKH
jgi:hypothetical protein